MSEPDDHPRGPAGPPASVEEALARARQHGRAAAGEAALAVRALLDAVSLRMRGVPGEQDPALSWLAAALEDAARGLGRETAGKASLLGAVAEALDVEIARWERRAKSDREARAVLRAYLGLREILWELGLRAHGPQEEAQRENEADASHPPEAGRSAGRGRRRPPGPGPRLQRVPVEG